MSTILARLGIDRSGILAALERNRPIATAEAITPTTTTATPITPQPTRRPRKPKPTKYKSITRRLLPVHTSRATLPKRGTVRPDDGYVFGHAQKHTFKDGHTIYRERWLSPACVARQKAKHLAAHPGTPYGQKYPVTTHRPTQYKRGDIGPTGMVFLKYTKYQRKDCTVVWYQRWYAPNTPTAQKILAQKRSK